MQRVGFEMKVHLDMVDEYKQRHDDIWPEMSEALIRTGWRNYTIFFKDDGTLFGEGVKTRIKEKLLTECNLHTIVRLPNGVFNPYTSIKTNILFFEKGKPTKDVWYYEHPYPPGAKSYNKTKPIDIKEFEPEKKWWKKRKETEFAWKVTAEKIAANNYNLDIKNPNAADSGPGDPDKLLTEYQALLGEVAETRDKLKAELAKALGGGAQ